MVLCARCGFEKNGILCSEATSCAGRCLFEGPGEQEVLDTKLRAIRDREVQRLEDEEAAK